MAKRNKQLKNEDEMRIGEFGSAILQIAEEKGISKDKIIETIEAALAAAYKKDYGKKGQHIRAEFNEINGETKFYLIKEVVDETTREFPSPEAAEEKTESATVAKKAETEKKTGKKKVKKEEKADKKKTVSAGTAAEGPASPSAEEKIPRYNPERDILLKEAKKLNKKAKVGDIIETELESQSDFGRVAAQTAKQVIIQRIREAERDAMFKEYKEKEGEVVSGAIQRVEGRNVYVDIGKSIGVLFPSEQIEGENYRIGQRLKVYLARVEADPKGPGITLSRTHPEMISKLFELEVPEIFSGTVEIKAVAREAGARTKIAVASNEEGVDPIGSCVGQKGTRVQAVIDELGGEKIDIIEWNEDPEKFIAASLSPAKVLAVTLDEEKKEATVKVPEDQLSLAIGKRGQNVRLAAKLTGWRIDMIGETPKGADSELKDKGTEPARNASQSDAGGEQNNKETKEPSNKETEKPEGKEKEEEKEKKAKKTEEKK